MFSPVNGNNSTGLQGGAEVTDHADPQPTRSPPAAPRHRRCARSGATPAATLLGAHVNAPPPGDPEAEFPAGQSWRRYSCAAARGRSRHLCWLAPHGSSQRPVPEMEGFAVQDVQDGGFPCGGTAR